MAMPMGVEKRLKKSASMLIFLPASQLAETGHDGADENTQRQGDEEHVVDEKTGFF